MMAGDSIFFILKKNLISRKFINLLIALAGAFYKLLIERFRLPK